MAVCAPISLEYINFLSQLSLMIVLLNCVSVACVGACYLELDLHVDFLVFNDQREGESAVHLAQRKPAKFVLNVSLPIGSQGMHQIPC